MENSILELESLVMTSQNIDSFVQTKIFPLIPSTTLGQVSKLLEVIKPDISSLCDQARGEMIKRINKTCTLSFEPGPAALAKHIQVCSTLWDVIQSDNESNAVLAIKIFMDIYKVGQVVMDSELSTRLHQFVMWLRGLYANAGRVFDGNHSASTAVLRECTLMANVLIQSFSGAAESYLSSLIGDMINLMSISIETVPESGRMNLVDTQVKTLTFIAFIGRSSRWEMLKSFDQQIARCCLKLLKTVHNWQLRKELLLSLRSYMHSPDLCVAFVPLIDELFDETVSIGTGRTCYEFVRPITVATLADFANTVRDKIPIEKLRAVLRFFCGAMSDSELPVSTQFTSARIILNLIDHAFNKSSNRLRKLVVGDQQKSAPDGSDILREVLRNLVEKFSSLLLFIPKVICLVSDELQVDLPPTAPRIAYSKVELLTKLLGKSGGSVGVPLPDMLIEGVREVRSLIRTLLLSSKMIVHCLTHRVSSRILTKSDMSLLESLIEDGLKVSHLFSCAAGYVQSAGFDLSTGVSSANGGGRFANKTELAVACSVQEERELIEQLAGVLVVIPPVSLADLLSKRISWILDSTQVNSQLMTLCNSLVQHPTSMVVLCEVIYGYLAVKGEELLIGHSSTAHLIRQTIIDPSIDPGMNEAGPKSESSIPTGAMRLHPSMFHFKSTILDHHPNSLLGPASSCAYFVGDSGAVDGPLLVSHVMPSLDLKLRVYSDVVVAYGLRDQPVKFDLRDVVVTLTKTISRQVLTYAATNGTSTVILESVVRPFVTEITMACFRVARGYPSSTIYCLGVLRYMYRLMGSGMKTTATSRELAEMVPLIMEQCMSEARYSSSPHLRALWLEVGLTVPVRLKSLISVFEIPVACLCEILSLDGSLSGETISVGLSVLESWVDGLTPDFLFPLVPGYGEHSLTRILFNLTRPPKGHVVHTTISGNNSVRATKILGKLGARSKFTFESNNVLGSIEENLPTVSLELLLNTNGVLFEVKMDEPIRVALGILAFHSQNFQHLPVCLQEVAVDINEVQLYPAQELLDSLNIVMCALSAVANDSGTDAVILAHGLIDGLACSCTLVADKARELVDSIITETAVKMNELHPLIIAATQSRRIEAARYLISNYLSLYPVTVRGGCPKTFTDLITLVQTRLGSYDPRNVYAATLTLQGIVEHQRASLVMAESGEGLIDQLVFSYLEAQGTRTSAPSISNQSEIVNCAVSILKILVPQSYIRENSNQEQSIAYINKQGAKLNIVKTLTLRLLTLMKSLPVKSLAESLIHVVASLLNVSLAALVCWVDPDMDMIITGLTDVTGSAIFQLTSFVLQMRPAPVLANPASGERLHQALLHAINRAVEWIESEDELSIVHGLKQTGSPVPQGVAPQQHYAYLLQRSALKRSLVPPDDSGIKVIEAMRVLKLTLLHTQLGAGSQHSPVPPHFFSANSNLELTWKLEERIMLIFLRSLFSFDYEIVAAAMYCISVVQAMGISISDQSWVHALVPLAREVASRSPAGLSEIQGLGRLLQLIPQSAWADETRADLSERLFERMHTYLSMLRERTYAPLQPPAPGSPVISWRCGFGHDSVVALTAVTLESFTGLVSDRLPLVERLLSLATQLDASLPSTFAAGQICTPFLNPLLACLCRDPERTADQLLTKLELHKVFGFVAELVSLKSCLGLRKALQDKCHQMSLMDTGVLMMRTAAASLISVLARHDPGYLWIQYCSVVMKASMGMPRSVSLVESLIRNWESNVASLTSGGGLRPSTNCLSPGGIVGPCDTGNSVTSYEGRIVAWSVMQFIRAPMTVSAISSDLDSHLNIRVRLLIRLATSLALKHYIEISTVQDWFLAEAAELTTITEKREIVSKSIDAFADGVITVGCKYVLLRYLIVPQVEAGINEHGSNFLDDATIERLATVMFGAENEEAVSSELIRLLILLLPRLKKFEQVTSFLISCISQDGLVAKQSAAYAISMIGSGSQMPLALSALMTNTNSEHWREYLEEVPGVIGKGLAGIFKSNQDLLNSFVTSLVESTDLTAHHVHVWKWFTSISPYLDSVKAEIIPACLSLLSRRTHNTTEGRVICLDVGLVVANWIKNSNSVENLIVLTNFFLRHIIAGPEPVALPSVGAAASSPSMVSPTLVAIYTENCLEGVRLCCKSAAIRIDFASIESSLHLPRVTLQAAQMTNATAGTPEVTRHCKQMIGLLRFLNEYYSCVKVVSDPGQLAHVIGIAMVSTDKSVCFSLSQLIETVGSILESPADPLNDPSPSAVVYKQLWNGIQAGLTVACNNTGSTGRLRIHPLNPNSPSLLVTPYMAIASLVALLRGFIKCGKAGEVGRWLSALEPLIVKAVAQGSRSLVFGLLPQHLHSYALGGTKTPGPEIDPASSQNGSSGTSFAYPGILQGAESAVPSLLQIIRIAHISVDTGLGSGNGGNLETLHSSIMWLIECLGPFLTFASANHQTFAHLLNGLNFTVPQQSQKLSGAPTVVGGLSSMISVVQLTALMRHCIGIVSRWCLGSSYSVSDSAENSAWAFDDLISPESGDRTDDLPALMLSLSTALVGPNAIMSCCDVTPIAALAKRRDKFNPSGIERAVLMYESIDGIAILSSLSDSSIKKLLGFIPRRSVTCFPGSVLSSSSEYGWIGSDVSGLWSSKAGQGGLFAIATEAMLEITKKVPNISAILIGCSSYEFKSLFVPFLEEISPKDIYSRLNWILKEVPWNTVSGRMMLPTMLRILLVGSDDRIQVSDEQVRSSDYSWFKSVVSLAGCDGPLSYAIWTDCFPPILDSLAQSKKSNIYQSLIQLLTRPFMSKQCLFNPNVPKAILSTINASLPVPLLVHCAENHGLYFEVLELLEAMAVQEAYKDNLEVWSAIEMLYTNLGEKDSVYGTLVLGGVERETSAAISYLSQNRNSEGLDILESNMNSLQPENQWIISRLWKEANQSLSQWNRLLDVVNDIKDPEFKLQVLGSTNEWGQVADVMSQYDWSTKGWSKMYAAYLALSFSDSCHKGTDAQTKQKLFLADMEASINRSYHNLVSDWSVLPDPLNCEASRNSLLLCQEFVEFGEASGLVTDIRAAITGTKPNYPTPKQLLNSWRDRLPDENDSLKVWTELLSLRMVIFLHIQQQCSVDVVATSHIAPYLHDYPWSLVKLAQVSVRENLGNTAQSALQRFQQSLTRSTDAFNQELFEALKEQINLYMASDREDDWRIGLNVLNCCAISNSNSQQAAEISALQGRLQIKLGLFTEGKNSLLFATNTYPMISNAWLDLGDLLFSQLDDPSSSDSQGEECVMAYMLALTLRPSRATQLVPRLLSLSKRFKSLGEKSIDSQSSSVWAFWTSLLVGCLDDESLQSTATSLLRKVGTSYPQSVYFALQGQEERLDSIIPDKSKIEELEVFTKFIADSFEEDLSKQMPTRLVAESLQELRYKRTSVVELKTRLSGILKTEPNEANLVRWLEAQKHETPSTRQIYLGDVNSRIAGTIEIPGSYTRIISLLNNTTMESMNQVKIAAIDSTVEYITELIGGYPVSVPKLTIVGSNGLRYSYHVKSRSSLKPLLAQQLYALVNGLCEKHSQTKQRGIKFDCLQHIPFSRNGFLVEAPGDVSSFENLIVGGIDIQVSKHKKLHDSANHRTADKVAFDQMMNEAEDDIISAHFGSQSAEGFYAASKRLTKGIALSSVVDYVLGISGNERPLSSLKISKHGRVCVEDFDLIRFTQKDFGHSPAVPFRLTRSVIEAIGQRNMVALLPASMRAVSDALSQPESGLIEFLELIASVHQGANPKVNAQHRISELTELVDERTNLNHKIIELINESMEHKKLAAVVPKQWLPWI